MGKTLEQQLAELQRPNQTYNMWAVAGAAVPSAILGVDAFIKNRKAKTDLKKQQGYVDNLMKNYMETPIYNPYDNLSVATQANQIKMEETDKALANTLDTLRAQGSSAGGATALAQAALRSKAGIAADIEKQEVGNERLKAQGEIMVQNAEMQRKGQQMDYEQSKADQLRMEQFAYGERAADMAGALGGLGLQAARGLGSENQQGQSQVRRDQSLIDSQLATGNQVTSGVDVDALTRSQPQDPLTRSQPQDPNSDIDIIVDEEDQPINELDLDPTLASPSLNVNQPAPSMRAITGKTYEFPENPSFIPEQFRKFDKDGNIINPFRYDADGKILNMYPTK